MLDIQRHASIFDARAFLDRGHRVTVIGATETGSRLCRHLAQLGVPFEIYDDTTTPNASFGAFGLMERNAPKVDALARILIRDTGAVVTTHAREHVLPGDEPGNIVFLCVPGTELRRRWCEYLRTLSVKIDLFVDVQAGIDAGEISVVQPHWLREVELYRRAIERRAETPPDDRIFPVTAEYISAVATHQLIRWFNLMENGPSDGDYLDRNIAISMRSLAAHRDAVLCFPEKFRRSHLRVTVIGGGAIGSRVGRNLASLTIPFSLYEFDRLEGHNIANQAYGLEEIGLFKGDALRRRLRRDFGVRITVHGGERGKKFDEACPVDEIVFVCPDNMACRTALWNAVKFSTRTKLVIEARMAPYYGKIYTVFPRAPRHLHLYEATLCSDEVAVDRGAGACRAAISVGPTAECIASRMVWQLVRWFVGSAEERSSMDHQIFDYITPPELVTSVFR